MTRSLGNDLLKLRPPERLTARHIFRTFDSGTPLLDGWLRDGALRKDAEGAVHVYVACQDKEVVAFYCLTSGIVFKSSGPSARPRGPSASVAVMILGRLAVESRLQGQGLGKALVRDAVLRTLQAAKIAAIQAILVHAKDEDARGFYQHCGFLPSPIDRLTLMLPLKEAHAAVDLS